MFYIKKMRCDHVIDHAAEELKKYLRMMMPDEGDVAISFEPDAKDGFRLGLLEDFGLESEAKDARLDDVIHVDAGPTGGILAGSNMRSILFAVYRFLRENGCRWLYPGIDGDFVPVKKIESVKYHKMADHRFRGFCNEGTESQRCMIDAADYYAKLEMNVYMLEFFVPFDYYDRFYSHNYNTKNRKSEPVSRQQVLQWKRMCEVEISKRGLMFHDIGHDWTCAPFGFYDLPQGRHKAADVGIPQETIDLFALLKGKRDLFSGLNLATQLCYSRKDVRSRIADAVVEYARTHSNSDYLHVWLADGSMNHCECENCAKHRPSDWYVLILNEIDEKLTKAGLKTRIVFIVYVDTLWGPEEFTLKNPDRFSLLYAPISRSYTSSITEKSVIPEAKPYIRNAWERPVGAEENLALLNTWRKTWKGPVFCYEYHFWRHQYNDPGGMDFAKRLYEDVRGIKYMEIDGFVEDGSQRSGFPNAFPIYVYANTLMNREISFEEMKKDYFSHIYGEKWEEAVSLLEQISYAFDFNYMEGERIVDKTISPFYDPARVPRLEKIKELCAQERRLAEENFVSPVRVQTVSWKLLLYHTFYCEQLAKLLIAKAKGQDYIAIEELEKLADEMGKFEWDIEPYYDHCLACNSLKNITRKPKGIILF